MFLRSLTLKGFKSFAESTTLEFEPGLNVVVGPNGSGKSNIVDAVAWVLGAQGPKAVRSARMDDVIFAGTGRKAALGRAEVILTIDNSAGLLGIDLAEVTITRTLFRTSGESEYALNGAPCRLLDLQELLSDSGVGRQQHVIVSQGNLDAVLDARPEDRRLIIEEAAGILKFRRRKEKAERRLQGTEANLVRLTDLLREVSRQMRPLERQADAARRHGSLVEETRALQLYLRGRELAVLGVRAETAASGRNTLAGEEERVRAGLRELDEEVASAESALTSASRSRLSDVVGRMEALRERARGLGAVLAERRRSAERDMAVVADLDVAATMRADREALGRELAEVDAEAVLLHGRSQEIAADEATLAAARAAQPVAEERATVAAETRGELAARRAALDRANAELDRARRRSTEIGQELSNMALERESAVARLAEGSARQEEAAQVEQRATAEAKAAQEQMAEADAAARQASDEHRRWAARAEALAEAVGRDRSDPSTPLSQAAGVMGMLVDLVTVDQGMDAAFEAGVRGAVDTLVVKDSAAARTLLAATTPAERPARVVVLGSAPPPAQPRAAPGRPLRACVRSEHSEVEALLDRLLEATVVVDGWTDAVDAVISDATVTAVTTTGDRFSADGWWLGVGRAGVARAALVEARAMVERSQATKREADAELATARIEAERLSAIAQAAGNDLRIAESRLGDVRGVADRLDADLLRIEGAAAQAQAEIDRVQAALDDDHTLVARLEDMLPSLVADEAESSRRASAFEAEALRIQQRGDELSARRAELDVRMAEVEERRRQLTRRLDQVESRLSGLAADEAASDGRRVRAASLLAHVGSLSTHLGSQLTRMEADLDSMRVRRDRHAKAVAERSELLDRLRVRRHGEERRLEEVRERARRTELEEAESRMRLEAAVESLRRELEVEPEVAMAAECPAIPAGSSATSRARELERELRLMGQVNPLALEELTALQERHAFLTAQLDDVKASRRELAKVIRAVETEMAELLGAAYADVEEHFAQLFETLFPGGRGRLTLTDPEHLLESGIEVDARPAGKNVRKLSLLSGGERSLVALAFLFAVFRSRPSPFYLLDEVEAALDDVNLHRFVDLLDEFRTEAQLLVVTHQKRTMEAADCLYGVTMQPGGSSRVLSERVATPV